MDDDIKALKEALAAGPTPGPWSVDSTKNDGEYGDGGPDSRAGFSSFVLITEDGKSICDTLNSDIAEVEEDWAEDGGSAWDRVGQRNLEYIAAASPDRIARLLARLEAAERDAIRLRAMLTMPASEFTHQCIKCLHRYAPVGLDENCPACGCDGTAAMQEKP